MPSSEPPPRPARLPERKPPVTLPEPEFFYTLDQVALILSVEESWLRQRVFFMGRNPKRKRLDDLEAINIARPDEKPVWRISQRELTRWLIRHGYPLNPRHRR